MGSATSMSLADESWHFKITHSNCGKTPKNTRMSQGVEALLRLKYFYQVFLLWHIHFLLMMKAGSMETGSMVVVFLFVMTFQYTLFEVVCCTVSSS
jgi:hypothetical protein